MKVLFLLLFLVSCKTTKTFNGAFIVESAGRILTCEQLAVNNIGFMAYDCVCLLTDQKFGAVLNVQNVLVKDLK